MFWGVKWCVIVFASHYVRPTRVSGSFFTAGRLIYVAGREGYLPALFGRLHPTRKTPLNAMLLQASITIAFIVLGGGFRSLINFAVVASWAFYFLTVRVSPVPMSMTQCFKGLGSRDFEN
jgi:amino acid transporter